MKKDIKTLLGMIKKIKYIMDKKQRRSSAKLLLIVVIGAVFETVGISAILPFMQAIITPEIFFTKWYIAPLVHLFNIKSESQIVYLSTFGLILIYIIKNSYLLFSSYMQCKFRCTFQRDLSVKMFNSYLYRPYTYFLDINSSEVLRGINNDVDGVYRIVEYSYKFLTEFLATVLIGVFLLVTDIFMTTGILCILILCFLFITFGFKKILTGVGEQQRIANALMYKYSNQAMSGIKEINVMKQQRFFVDKYSDSVTKSANLRKKYEFLGTCPERFIETICIGTLLIIVVIRTRYGVNMNDFLPTLAAFAVGAFRILPSVSRMTGYTSVFVYNRPAIDAAYSNIKDVNDFNEQKSIGEYYFKNEKLIFEREICINNISWKYPKTSKNTLENLVLKIKKGESVAFIGTSGAGKTTLADIMLGLLIPQKGSVEVDGQNIFEHSDAWSKIIGFVPQNVYMTDDTIKNNIALGIDESDINEDDIWNALEQAQLSSFVHSLPKELETVVGERGIKFSGGQRQRIAIARALYYNPDILVLDEATSALDKETEDALMSSVEELQGKKTIIIIAHRLSTIHNCDKIYEIKDGKAFLCEKKDIFI